MDDSSHSSPLAKTKRSNFNVRIIGIVIGFLAAVAILAASMLVLIVWPLARQAALEHRRREEVNANLSQLKLSLEAYHQRTRLPAREEDGEASATD